MDRRLAARPVGSFEGLLRHVDTHERRESPRRPGRPVASAPAIALGDRDDGTEDRVDPSSSHPTGPLSGGPAASAIRSPHPAHRFHVLIGLSSSLTSRTMKDEEAAPSPPRCYRSGVKTLRTRRSRGGSMATDCIAQLTFRYQRLRAPIVARFDVPHASSDGGLVLLKAVDDRLHLTETVARCLTDPRQPGKGRALGPGLGPTAGLWLDRGLSRWQRRRPARRRPAAQAGARPRAPDRAGARLAADPLALRERHQPARSGPRGAGPGRGPSSPTIGADSTAGPVGSRSIWTRPTIRRTGSRN